MKNDAVKAQICNFAKMLKIPTFSSYDDVLNRAGQDGTFSELLLELMKREYEQRQENQNSRRLKQAGFPYAKTLEELDLSQYGGGLTDLFVRELASCQYIKDRKNVVMFGNPGRGKTHMAIGLGLKACGAGMKVLFKNAAKLSTELTEAQDNYALGRLENRLRRADLLILDEMGYVSFDRHKSELLFRVVADRSERGSIVVTTNLPFSEWVGMFDNTPLVTALIDRLTYRSYLLDMNGQSYRLKKSRQMQGELKGKHLSAANGDPATGNRMAASQAERVRKREEML